MYITMSSRSMKTKCLKTRLNSDNKRIDYTGKI